MNLRHKKPINSYRGQANNDKNEFNDDDFKHQPSPSKKFFTSSGEQMYKYSKILAKFIMNANQYYRDRNKIPRKPKNEIENILEEAKTTRDETRNSKYAKRSQQPKQKRKIISKIQHEKLQQKQQKQKQSYKIESQSKFPKELPEIQSEKQKPKINTAKTTMPPNEFSQSKIQPPVKDKNPLPMPQNFMNPYAQGIPMNGFPNPNLLANMSVNQYMECYNEMMRLSMLQQMFKTDQLKGMNFPNLGPQFMTGMISSPDILKQSMYQNYMRTIPQPQVPTPKKNPPIHNLTQVYLSRTQPLFNQSKQKPNEIVKRANFHIGIAYHIYLKDLQAKNISPTNIQEIDPTRQSREIKEREQGNKRSSRSRSKK